MKIIKITDKNALKLALNTLKKGNILIYPTETCYGVGVDATNKDAVSKVLKYKERPEGKPISIGVYNKRMAFKYVDINKSASNIYDNFLPGAVTVISKSKNTVDKRLESEKSTLGIRIPNFEFLLNLLKQFKKPITTTSANSSGKKTPYTIDDILNNLSEKQKELVDLIIDANELPHNPPSTVIDTTSEVLNIYRAGRIDPSKVKKNQILISNSVEETIEAGFNLMNEVFLNNKDINKENISTIILLNGELGAGKTHFTKGIAKFLNIKKIIKSPTYNYVNEYKFQIKGSIEKLFFHFDAWRIQNKEELDYLEFENWFQNNNIIVIEWASVIFNLNEEFFKNKSYIYIDFVNLEDNKRKIKINYF